MPNPPEVCLSLIAEELQAISGHLSDAAGALSNLERVSGILKEILTEIQRARTSILAAKLIDLSPEDRSWVRQYIREWGG